MKTTLETKHLKQIISNDDLKPALCGVYFDTERRELHATNGHIAMIQSGIEPSDTDKSAIIPVAAFGKGAEIQVCEKIVATCNGTKTEMPAIDETYPNVPGVWPDGEPEYEIGLDLDLLNKIRLAMLSRQKTVHIKFYGKTSAALIKHTDKDSQEFLLMPVRLVTHEAP